ncbi:MAG: hypothetical protein GXO19_04245 [Epsilonproteobacteria bacterium]|nr:hypothetical protein [Campylobacterota bacterium]NPA56933.1 hypothetical protein [Campylobacterota bacterium]
MKKFLLFLLGLLVLLVGGVAGLLFTRSGNELARPYIEKALKERLPVDLQLERFSLFPVDIRLSLADGSTIEVDGKIDPLKQAFDLNYSVRVKELANLKPLTNADLQGPLNTDGRAYGVVQKFAVEGESDVAQSDTSYRVQIVDLDPKFVVAQVKQARIEKLLHMVKQPQFIYGRADLDANLTDLNPDHLKGNFDLLVKRAVVNRRLMKKNFKVNLPKTVIRSATKAKLVGQKITFASKTNSNLLKLDLKGVFNVKGKAINMKYNMKVGRLELLKPITQAPLRGPLNTSGSVRGRLEGDLKIVGVSDIAKSRTDYNVEIVKGKPRKVIANMQKARIEKLLYMVEQPQFLSGILNLKANLTSLDPKRLKGDFTVKIDRGVVNRTVMKRSFGVDLPKTVIRSLTKAKLAGEKVTFASKTNSNLLKLDLKGLFNARKESTAMEYDLKIGKLELLKPITKADLRGPLNTKGKVHGDKRKMKVSGSSDLAGSQTTYTLLLKEYKPTSVQATINGARLSKLLYMVYEPIYAEGKIDGTLHLTNLDPAHLTGKIDLNVRDGVTKPTVLKKEFDFEQARITFHATNKLHFQDGKGQSDLHLVSSVADLVAKDSLIDLGKGSLKAPYTLTVPDLNKLYFVTKRHLKGKIRVNGEIDKEKDRLLVTAHSNTLGGKVDLRLLNDDLTAHLKGIQFTALTDMLLYPRVFTSSLDADLRYNLASKKGNLLAQAFDGRILPNQLSFLLAQMAKFDITKEIYKKTTLTSRIEDQKIISDLDMKSRLTHIVSQDALLDLKRNQVYAKLQIDIQGRPVYVKIKGDVQQPKITLDVKSLFKSRVKKELNKRLEKEFGDKIPDVAKEIMNLF